MFRPVRQVMEMYEMARCMAIQGEKGQWWTG